MNEEQIIQIVQNQLNTSRYQAGNPIVQRHIHNGVDSPKISQSNVIPITNVNGAFQMAQNATYTFNLPGNQIPQAITFYGGAIDTTDSPKMHAIGSGSAQFNNNQQFQPGTSTSVNTGSVSVDIIQGGSYLVITDGLPITAPGTYASFAASYSPASSILRLSGSHIVYVTDASNNVYARATILSYSATSIQVKVELAANWSIYGYWLVT